MRWIALLRCSECGYLQKTGASLYVNSDVICEKCGEQPDPPCATCHHPQSYHLPGPTRCIGSPKFPFRYVNNWEGPEHVCPPHEFQRVPVERRAP